MAFSIRVNEAWDTPETLDELSKWLEKVNDPLVTKGAMLMMNFVADNYTLNVKEQQGRQSNDLS